MDFELFTEEELEKIDYQIKTDEIIEEALFLETYGKRGEKE